VNQPSVITGTTAEPRSTATVTDVPVGPSCRDQVVRVGPLGHEGSRGFGSGYYAVLVVITTTAAR
jgi:hypothetical protein